MILQGLIYASAQPRDERASSLSTEAHDMREGAVCGGHLLVAARFVGSPAAARGYLSDP
jgi:hypothetical protein